MSLVEISITGSESNPLAPRVWRAMLLLVLIQLAALFSGAVFTSRASTGMTFVLATTTVALFAGIFLVLLGERGDARRLIASVAIAMVLSLAVALALQWGVVHDASHADTSGLAWPWNWIDDYQRMATSATSFSDALAGHVFGVAIFEETIKFLPAVFVLLIAGARKSSARQLMLCAAMAGLSFGTVEAITLSKLNYVPEHASAWQEMLRFLICAPGHAFWPAIAMASACALMSSSCNRLLALLAGWSIACVMHGAQNAVQSVYGGIALIPANFASLLVFFVCLRWAWRLESSSRKMPECCFFFDSSSSSSF